MGKQKGNSQSLGLSVDDVGEVPSVNVSQSEIPVVELPVNVVPQGSQFRPHCTVHNCYMIPRGTQGGVTHYICKVPGCDCKQKVARAKTAIPSEPMECSRITCRDPKQYLQVDMNFLGQAKLRMRCPQCGHTVEVQRPAMASISQRTEAVDDISSR